MSRWAKTIFALILTILLWLGSLTAFGIDFTSYGPLVNSENAGDNAINNLTSHLVSGCAHADTDALTIATAQSKDDKIIRDNSSASNPSYVAARDYGVPGRKALADALAAIRSSNCTLVLAPGPWAIDADLGIPANVTLKLERGAMIVIAAKQTLSINGFLEAGFFQIFSCSRTGKVVFGPGTARELAPQWWGARGDAVTDDTAALQAMIDCSVNSKIGFCLPSGVYRTTDELTTSGALSGVTWRGGGSGGAAVGSGWNGGTIIKYDGATDNTKAVFRVDDYHFSRMQISGITFDANKKAGYAFLLNSSDPQTNKSYNNFTDCSFGYGTVTGVCFGSPDLSEATKNIDGNLNNFYNCHFVSNPYNFFQNASNLYCTSFYNCMFTYYSIGDAAIPLAHIWNARGGVIHIYNPYFSPSTNARFQGCILAGAGGISIHGGWSEDPRILKTDNTYGGWGGFEDDITIDSFGVNVSSGSGLYAVYAPYGNITLRDCKFATSTYYRKVYVAGRLRASNVELGSSGTFELDKPYNCEIEGFQPGRVRTLNPNPLLQHWSGSAADNMPLGYVKLSGSGFTGTVTRDVTNAVYGSYTAHCVCTVKGTTYGLGLLLNGERLEAFRGQQLVVVVTGTYKAGDFAKLYGLLEFDVSGTVGFSFVDLGAGKFIGYTHKTIGTTDTKYYINTGLKDAGECWIDSIVAFPAGLFSGSVYKAIGGYGAWDNSNEEILKAGYAPLGLAAANKITIGTAAPNTGTWATGDLCFNRAPDSGQPIGWQCKTGGSPGTWKPMGNMP